MTMANDCLLKKKKTFEEGFEFSIVTFLRKK